MHQNVLRPEKSAFLIIDVQEAFRESIADLSEIASRISVFAQGARLLNVPILVTEQYPKGLGRTIPEISEVLTTENEIFEKTAFSSCGANAFVEKLEAIGARQIIVAGIEAHVCVNQTVHDLLARGFQTHLLTDCISSRAAENKQIALAKMQASSTILSSVEMALFELMRDARHEQFKAVQKLIK
ncbi:MAG TPA: isochorismatase family protein [Pyrinomonadaceae bacterium]|jgi:nicotinamidase-related amidase